MKNIAVLSVLVIILNVHSYAQENENNYCFSFGPQFGFAYGQAKEYVYPAPGETGNELLSELLWDMKPVFFYGLQAEFGRIDLNKAPGGFSSISFKAGIPADSGNMEDRDWFYPSNNEVTRYSCHTNKTAVFIQLDAAAGVSIPVNSFLYLKIFLGGSWMRFSFTGRDGYGIYNDVDPKEQNFTGKKAISYSQDWLIPMLGLSAGTNILYPFSFEILFKASPYSYCSATDNHYLRRTVFRDFTEWGGFFEPSLKASYSAKMIDFSFELSYRYIGKTEGRSYYNENNTGFHLDTSKAGAGLSLFELRFFACFKL